jgi:hypothetical protein
MEGSIPKKIGRIGLSALSNPSHIPKYLHSQIKSPLSLGVPWISYSAIEFLDSYLNNELDVFEFGSGGSTIYFGEKARSVISVEESKTWAEAVTRELDVRRIENACIIDSDWDISTGVEGLNSSNYLDSLEGYFDLIFVDGQCAYPRELIRPICYFKAVNHLKAGGIIVVDDSWRYDSLLKDSGYTSKTVFKSLGPCRPGVTTTTVYHF